MSRFKSFSKWIGTPVAAMFLLVNLVTNSTTLHDYHTTLSVLLVVAVSALVATAELALYHLLRKVRLHKVFLVVMVALHVVVMVTDAFLIKQFGFIFDNHAMYILAATDRTEIRSFLSTYLSVPVAAGIVLALVAMLWLLWWLARFLARRRWFASAYCALLALGVVASGAIATNFLFRHNGMGLHLRETHAFSRVGHACKAMNDRLNEFVALREVNRHVTATLRQQEHTPSVVLIIGESFSVYHSSLYGYRKPTNPRLGARQADGSLVVFDDAVSQADFTDAAMCSIFTLTEPGDPWWSAPLFPVVFRTAGFATQLVDNQYEIGGGLNSFFYDAQLSQLMFDRRNEHRFNPDDAALAAISVADSMQLVVIHLTGQHFTYAEHYTQGFARFKPSDYKGLTQSQCAIAAHYDNATLYNDYVVDEIIRKFEDKDCMVVYVSDHGEEIFEVDDFMGHGNASLRPDPSYQLRVPFMVWMSPKFMAMHSQVATRVKAAVHWPVITDDLPHFLLDVAGIENDHFNPRHSIVSERYDPSKPRIVRNGADYNELKKLPHVAPRY